MSKHLSFFILIIAIVCACKKNHAKDDIVYHEFSPNVEVNNIDSFGTQLPYPDCEPGIPIPGDSVAIYRLDVNSDSEPDLIVRVEHVPNPNGFSQSYPCNNFVSQMNITSTNNSQFSGFHGINESIDEKNNGWTGNFFLAGWAVPNFTGTGYLGFRVKNGNHYNYGWLKLKKITESNKHGLILLSYGYNNAVSNSILAGQEH